MNWKNFLKKLTETLYKSQGRDKMKKKLKDIDELVKIELSMHEVLSSIPASKRKKKKKSMMIQWEWSTIRRKESMEQLTLFEDQKRNFSRIDEKLNWTDIGNTLNQTT